MSTEKLDLTGRVAVVTGGGSGIGKATARLFAERGADVAIAGRTLEKLEKTAKEIGDATGRRIVPVQGDVSDPESAASIIERSAKEFGRIDILVNNAGGPSHGLLRNTTPEIWNRDMALNLHAAFYCSNAALPYLRKSGKGAVVNICSLAGTEGIKGMAGYSVSKSALLMYTKVAAAEWGPLGVRMNAVTPGMTMTEAAEASFAKSGFDVDAYCKVYALRRPAQTSELAEAVVFLSSDAASYITGDNLVVAGGPTIGGMNDPEA